jgi:hypothetical protein
MGGDDQLLSEVAAMYEGLRRARQTMELWLRVAQEDPAAPDAESIIRRLIKDVSEVLAPIEHRGSTRYVPPEAPPQDPVAPVTTTPRPRVELTPSLERFASDARLTPVA